MVPRLRFGVGYSTATRLNPKSLREKIGGIFGLSVLCRRRFAETRSIGGLHVNKRSQDENSPEQKQRHFSSMRAEVLQAIKGNC